jgi:endonuclease YncB( thermonuclease family)
MLVLLATGPGRAEDSTIVTGEARVIDADILIVQKTRIILWGIDAPERAQTCNKDADTWDCYSAAKRTLEILAGRGPIQCVLTGDPDPFGRRYGVCSLGSEDLNAEMIKKGMALAYSEQTSDYEPLQLQAITDGVGLWQAGVVFQEPWEWRRSHTPGGFR